ncbi:MAG: hypothetical protein EOQ36_22225 [Mesorhizobium sp.]|nr:MAG: hypothetical protein EOQ36_22225 [Mesorhizobium sp.]TJW50042.1 MAG: hypothetical protein E5X65_30765 [Mesorhizobium sp.]
MFQSPEETGNDQPGNAQVWKNMISTGLPTTACCQSRIRTIGSRSAAGRSPSRQDEDREARLAQFIRRFLLHTLPDGLHRIRRPGIDSTFTLFTILRVVVSKHFTSDRMCGGAGIILIDRCALAASRRQMTTI